jgi:hypothetical protein
MNLTSLLSAEASAQGSLEISLRNSPVSSSRGREVRVLVRLGPTM